MLGCYGNEEMHTPSPDAMAENGIRYTNAYSCQPVCGPARICPEGWNPDYWYDMKCYLEELSEQERVFSRKQEASDQGIGRSSPMDTAVHSLIGDDSCYAGE